jgi:hypothetical protein
MARRWVAVEVALWPAVGLSIAALGGSGHALWTALPGFAGAFVFVLLPQQRERQARSGAGPLTVAGAVLMIVVALAFVLTGLGLGVLCLEAPSAALGWQLLAMVFATCGGWFAGLAGGALLVWWTGWF